MSTATAPIRVLIADAYPIVIDGVRSILQHSPGIQIVGECNDGGETVEKVLQLDPDVLVLDLKLPRTDLNFAFSISLRMPSLLVRSPLTAVTAESIKPTAS